jgi:hypothetical protein
LARDALIVVKGGEQFGAGMGVWTMAMATAPLSVAGGLDAIVGGVVVTHLSTEASMWSSTATNMLLARDVPVHRFRSGSSTQGVSREPVHMKS